MSMGGFRRYEYLLVYDEKKHCCAVKGIHLAPDDFVEPASFLSLSLEEAASTLSRHYIGRSSDSILVESVMGPWPLKGDGQAPDDE